MSRLNQKQKWLRTIAWLRRTFPPARPIGIRSRRLSKSWNEIADCNLVSNRFLIQIRKTLNYDQKIDALLHEWAHALTWFGAEAQFDDHGSEWGVAFARVYKAWAEWDNKPWKDR